MSIRASTLALFDDMIREVQKRTDLKAVILFGSRARGTPNKYSDYDLVFIGDFKEQFADRRDWVRKLAPFVSMDLFCYTPSEFEQMFNSYRLTAIDAIGEGIVLHGEDFVAPFKQKYAEYVDRGLVLTTNDDSPPLVFTSF